MWGEKSKVNRDGEQVLERGLKYKLKIEVTLNKKVIDQIEKV